MNREALTADTTIEKPKISKEIEEDSAGQIDAEDLKVKIDEIVYDARLKSRGYYYAKVDTPFYQKQKNKGKMSFFRENEI